MCRITVGWWPPKIWGKTPHEARGWRSQGSNPRPTARAPSERANWATLNPLLEALLIKFISDYPHHVKVELVLLNILIFNSLPKLIVLRILAWFSANKRHIAHEKPRDEWVVQWPHKPEHIARYNIHHIQGHRSCIHNFNMVQSR